MKKAIKVMVLGLFFTLPLTALAMTGYSDNVVVLEKDQVHEGNYYVAGNVIEIYGTVNGDIFAAGDTITIDSENINGDVFIAGSSVSIKGKINGSLRIAGENIDLSGEVIRNAMVAGKNFTVDSDSKLAGHLTFWGQVLSMSGQVDGRVEGAMENIRISGTVGQDLDVYLSSDKGAGIYLSDGGKIGGTVYYKALKEFEINENVVTGEVTFSKIAKKAAPVFGMAILLGLIIKFFGMLIVGMIGFYLWPKFFANSYELMYKKSVKTFFKGLLLLIVTPIACILIAITVIGLPVAIIAMALWAMLLYLATVMAAWLLGKFVKEKLFAKSKWHNLAILALGILLLIILKLIPIVGWVIVFVLYIIAWGTFMDVFKKEKN